MPEIAKTDAAPAPAPAPANDSKPKTMWVVSARQDTRVALWDPDPRSSHPGGEAFVAGNVPDEVAVTPEVSGKLRMGELREATAEEIEKRKKQLAGLQSTPTGQGPWD